jgi:serine/threonine-protein kinase
MSPEQCDGAKRVDQRTDVYALGVLAYKMLSGRVPFSAEGKGQVISMHLTQAPPPLGKWRPGLASEVEAVVMRALEKEPDARFQTIEEMGRALLAAVGLDSGVSLPERGFESQPTMAKAQVPREPKSPSTLAASASELSSAAPRSRRTLAWLVPSVALGLAAGGAAIWLAVGAEEPADAPAKSRPAARPAPPRGAEHDTPADEKTEPAADTSAPAEPVPPATVELAIESEPPGADVFRAADGVKVGTTPWHGAFARGPGEAMFLVKKAGFATERVSMSTTEGATRALVLAPAPAAAPRPAAAKPAPKKPTHDYKPRLPE